MALRYPAAFHAARSAGSTDSAPPSTALRTRASSARRSSACLGLLEPAPERRLAGDDDPRGDVGEPRFDRARRVVLPRRTLAATAAVDGQRQWGLGRQVGRGGYHAFARPVAVLPCQVDLEPDAGVADDRRGVDDPVALVGARRMAASFQRPEKRVENPQAAQLDRGIEPRFLPRPAAGRELLPAPRFLGEQARQRVVGAVEVPRDADLADRRSSRACKSPRSSGTAADANGPDEGSDAAAGKTPTKRRSRLARPVSPGPRAAAVGHLGTGFPAKTLF